jgi:hypothetical protein
MWLLLYEWYMSVHAVLNFMALIILIITVFHRPFSGVSNLASAQILHKSSVINSISQTTAVKFTLLLAIKAQKGSSGIALFTLNLGAR